MNNIDYTIILDKQTTEPQDKILFFKKINSSLLDIRLTNHIINSKNFDTIDISNFITIYLLAQSLKDIKYNNLFIIDKNYYNQYNLNKLKTYIDNYSNSIIFSKNLLALYITKKDIDQILCTIPYNNESIWYSDFVSINTVCLESFDSWEVVFE